MLLKDVTEGSRIDPDWLWLWRVGITINVLAWAAFLAQLAVFWFLCQQRPAIPPRIVSPAPVCEANATKDVIPT